MAAAPGNNYRSALKTKEEKEKVYADYCEWIASGKSHKSWHYDKDGLLLSWQTIETYIKNDKEFNPLHKEIAMSKSLDIWERDGQEMMVGKIEKSQPAIYQMFMRNKFGWDKREDSQGATTIIVKSNKHSIETESNDD